MIGLECPKIRTHPEDPPLQIFMVKLLASLYWTWARGPNPVSPTTRDINTSVLKSLYGTVCIVYNLINFELIASPERAAGLQIKTVELASLPRALCL